MGKITSFLRSRAKKAAFTSIAAVLVLGALGVAEFLAGQTANIASVRSEARRFLTESAPLITSAQRLEPNLVDEFINEQASAGQKRLLRTDRFGLVLGPSDVKYEDSARKILFLGGSTTENNEVDEQYRFPYLAPFQLSKSMGGVFEGVNAGVRGHTSHDSLTVYLNHPSPKIQKADIVVIMHNINDRLRLTLGESYRSSFRNSPDATASGLKGAIVGLARSILEWGRLSSNFVFLIDAVVSRIPNSEYSRGIHVTEKTLDEHTGIATSRIALFEQSLRNLVSVVKANGRLPILMTQPLGRLSEDQDAFNEVIRQVATEESIHFIDLARAIEEVSDRRVLFYDDHIHFNNHGSKWASDVISRALHDILGKTELGTPPGRGSCPDLRVGSHSLFVAPLHEDVLRGRYPSFDQSERRLLFQRNSSSGSSITVFDFSTGLTEDLATSSDPLGLEHPVWIDENSLLFTRRSGDNRKLMVLDLQDRRVHALLTDDRLQGAISNVGPDGRIYFAGYRYLHREAPALYVLDGGSSVPRPLTPATVESWRPFATSNGDIYFINNSSGRYQVYVKGLAEPLAAMRRVIPADFEQWDPAVSPDGRTLAFAQSEGGNFDLYVVQLHALERKPVRVAATAQDEWDPRISPSGRYLLYAASTPHGDQIRVTCLR